jgi:hypothetical protein
VFYFFKTYIFWRAGRGQIGDKKMNKMYVCFFFRLGGEGWLRKNRTNMFIFLDGWSRENLRQKN